MAARIKLKRLGKIRNPQYRIVVADARNKRDGRSIEEIGRYHPKEEPSLIVVDSERVQYWLGVGAQPTDAVMALLKITGDWQKFKDLPGAEGTLRVADAKADKVAVFAAAAAEAAGLKESSKPTLAPKTEEAKPVKVEEPKTEEPKVEEPKAEEPKVEEPKAEEPKAEEGAPAAEAATDTAPADAATDAPAAE